MLRRVALTAVWFSVPATAIMGFFAIGRDVGPRLEIPQHELLDIGSCKPGKVAIGLFDLRNTGSQPLSYTLEASCVCSELSPAAGTIEGGQTASIRVGIRLEHYGSDRTVTITIRSNDPQLPVSSLRVRGKCLVPFHVRPNRVDFGDVLEGSHPTAVVSLIAKSGGGFVVDGSSDTDDLVIERIEQSGAGKSFLVTLRPGLSTGDIRGTLTFCTASDDCLKIPATGRVVGPATAAPSILVLGKSAPTIQQSLSFFVVPFRGTDLGEVYAIDAPPGMEVLEDADARGPKGARRFKVSVSPRASASDARELRLRFENGSECVVKLVWLQEA